MAALTSVAGSSGLSPLRHQSSSASIRRMNSMTFSPSLYNSRSPSPNRQHSNVFGTRKPLTEACSYMSAIRLPILSDSEETLETLLLNLEATSVAIDNLDFKGDIRCAGSSNDSLICIENKLETLIMHTDFLRKRSLSAEESEARTLAQQIVAATDGIARTVQHARKLIDLALEWTEFMDSVIPDLAVAIAACQELAASLEGYRKRKHTEWPIPESSDSIAGLVNSLEQSPIAAQRKFVCLSEEDGKQNECLFEFLQNMQPLERSVKFLDECIFKLVQRLGNNFEEAREKVSNEHASISEQWQKLAADADSLLLEFGDKRWVALLIDTGNQARRLMSNTEQHMNVILDSKPDLGNMDSKVRIYESSVRENLSVILQILWLLNRADRDRVTSSTEVAREISHLQNFWTEFEEKIYTIDEKYGLDVMKVVEANPLSRETASRSSFRSSVSSRASLGLSFRGQSRCRSRSESQSSMADNDDQAHEASSPFETFPASTCEPEPTLNTVGRRKRLSETDADNETPTVKGKYKRSSLIQDSKVRQKCETAESAFQDSYETGSQSRQSDTKPRPSCIPQPKFNLSMTKSYDLPSSVLKSPVRSISGSESSMNTPLAKQSLKKQSMVDLRSRPSLSNLDVTPRRKLSSTAASVSAIVSASKPRRSLIPAPQTPQIKSPTKAGTSLATSQNCQHLPGTLYTKIHPQLAPARDTPLRHTPKSRLNHHASTPNLRSAGSLEKKPSLPSFAADKIANINAASSQVKSTRSRVSVARQPSSSARSQQQTQPSKFYIKYDSPSSSTTETQLETKQSLTKKKSSASLASRPRWR
ncbi:uncharacterized protein V1516DRAFT_663132 [Lipomyces oligophaga]|uniref:uncharacterized protein n=1 Tax=Lipomyces oligophaga TaxID=45792 RepID=UPI0034CDD1E3